DRLSSVIDTRSSIATPRGYETAGVRHIAAALARRAQRYGATGVCFKLRGGQASGQLVDRRGQLRGHSVHSVVDNPFACTVKALLGWDNTIPSLWTEKRLRYHRGGARTVAASTAGRPGCGQS